MEAPQDLMLKHKLNWTEGEITWLCPADAASGKMRQLVSEQRQSSAAMFTAATLAIRVCQVCLHVRGTGQTHLIQHEEKQQKNMTSWAVRRSPSTSASSLNVFFFIVLVMCVIFKFYKIVWLKSNLPTTNCVKSWVILSRTLRNNQNTKKARFFKNKGSDPVSKRLKCSGALKLCADKFLPEALRRAKVAAANVVWLFSLKAATSVCLLAEADATVLCAHPRRSAAGSGGGGGGGSSPPRMD